MAFNVQLFQIQLIYPNGDRYSGQVYYSIEGRCIPHGSGVKTFANGDVYTGSFYNDTFHGYGTFKGTNGDSYKGNYYLGLKHGKGELYEVAAQRRYVGEFSYGAEEGYAVITKNDYAQNGGQKRYEGYVRRGKRHGHGVQYITGYDGLVASFEGEWINGLLNGPGKQIHPIQCFEGTFVNGKLEGIGLYRDVKAGKLYSVQFVNGAIARYISA